MAPWRPRPMLRLGAATGAMLAAGLIAAPVLAQQPGGGQTPAAQPTDPYQAYGGVSLQGGEPPAPKTPPAGSQYINWPGFRSDRQAGQAEVFLQLTGPAPYQVKARGRRVEVVLDRVQVYLRNNFRPVITRHFARQPVDRFRLRQLKRDQVRLEIQLRRAATPQVEMRTIGRHTYLVVTFAHRSRRG